jgi:hypothetical protein
MHVYNQHVPKLTENALLVPFPFRGDHLQFCATTL